MSAHISPGCSVRSTISRMRVPPADTATWFTRSGPGGRLVVEATQGGSGYSWNGEALNGMSSSREAMNLSIQRCAGTRRISKVYCVDRKRGANNRKKAFEGHGFVDAVVMYRRL